MQGRSGFLLGDEYVVDCYVGDRSWRPAWFVEGVYTEPSARVLRAGQEVLSTDDAWTELNGTIAVPAEAEPGDYRMQMRIRFDGEPSDMAEVRFTVAPIR